MYELKKIKRYLRVNLLGPGPRLLQKEFTGPRFRNTVLEVCLTAYDAIPTALFTKGTIHPKLNDAV